MNGMPDTPDDAPCGPLALAVVVLCKDCEHWKSPNPDIYTDRYNPSDVSGQRCMAENWKGHKAEIVCDSSYHGCEFYTAPDFFCAYGTLRATKTREADMK